MKVSGLCTRPPLFLVTKWVVLLSLDLYSSQLDGVGDNVWMPFYTDRSQCTCTVLRRSHVRPIQQEQLIPWLLEGVRGRREIKTLTSSVPELLFLFLGYLNNMTSEANVIPVNYEVLLVACNLSLGWLKVIPVNYEVLLWDCDLTLSWPNVILVNYEVLLWECNLSLSWPNVIPVSSEVLLLYRNLFFGWLNVIPVNYEVFVWDYNLSLSWLNVIPLSSEVLLLYRNLFFGWLNVITVKSGVLLLSCNLSLGWLNCVCIAVMCNICSEEKYSSNMIQASVNRPSDQTKPYQKSTNPYQIT